MSTPVLTADEIDALYTVPVQSYSIHTPNVSPGATKESAEEVKKWLKADVENWHVFFNEKGYHNHLTHHLYAAYALGAPPQIIKEAYDIHAQYQRKAFQSPGPIDDKNWKEHLGDENYYNSYLNYFSQKVLTHGMSKTLETYVFSADSNTKGPKSGANPSMLSRFLGGLLHPLIHFGHGAEFNVPGQAAQGLAWTAVHPPELAALLPIEFFRYRNDGSVSTLTQLVAKVGIWSSEKTESLHSFSIVSQMLKDPDLTPTSDIMEDDIDNIETFIAAKGDVIRKYAAKWQVDATVPGELDSKLEEMSWLAVLLYGVGGWNENREFRADFFTMHFVTSSLFLPSVLGLLSPQHQSALLRAWFSVVLSYWIKRGRPNLHISEFYNANPASFSAHGPAPTPNPQALGKDNLTPNPWLPLIQTTIMHPDEHLVKAQRSMTHYSVKYGDRPTGYFKDTKLEGAELLDGTLFIRVAGLTSTRLGWLREGDKQGEWDRIGFADDEQ